MSHHNVVGAVVVVPGVVPQGFHSTPYGTRRDSSHGRTTLTSVACLAATPISASPSCPAATSRLYYLSRPALIPWYDLHSSLVRSLLAPCGARRSARLVVCRLHRR